MVRFICGASNCLCSELKTEPDSVCRCDVVVRSRLGHGRRGQEQPAIGGDSAVDHSRRLAWRHLDLAIGASIAASRLPREVTWNDAKRQIPDVYASLSSK